MSGIVLTEVSDATIPAPAAGKVTVYMSTEEAGPAFKDDADVVTPLQGATGGTGPTGPGYGGTSTTSLAIGTGSKAFTTQAGLAYVAGSRVRAASDADPDADWMEGVCSAYSGTTLIVLMDLTLGSGTHTDWNLSLAGEEGAAGAGVPPTVVAHGSMGAAETFDYGAGTAHEGDYTAALTVTLTGWVAGENIMTLDFTTDAIGGYGVPTFGAEVINDADLVAVWDDAANAHNVIVLRTIDSGTAVYIMGIGETPTLDAVIAVSSGEDIADALSGAAAPDAANVFATMADVTGASGLAQSYIGYNTIGGSQETLTAKRMLCKKVTLASAAEILSISAYIDTVTNGSSPQGLSVALFEDNSNAPGKVIAYNSDASFLVAETPAGTHGARWFTKSIGAHVAAGDYWIGFGVWVIATTRIYHDGSGSDQHFTSSSGATNPVIADGGFYTITTGTNKYSIRASVLS